jgi:hypothetical protein
MVMVMVKGLHRKREKGAERAKEKSWIKRKRERER